MEKDKCFRCDSEIGLLEAIYENEIVQVCEKCAKLESIPVLKRPSNVQLEEAERPYSVYERLAIAAGMKEKAKKVGQQISKNKEITLNKLRQPNFLKAKEDPELRKRLNLIDNFHWEIFRERRGRRLSQKELAEIIDGKEEDVKALEYGQLGEDSEQFIKKIEDFFKIKLSKNKLQELKHLPLIMEERGEKREEKIIEEVKMEIGAKELVRVEQEGIHLLEEFEKEEVEKRKEEKPEEKELDEGTMKNITISDLREIGGDVSKKIEMAGREAGKGKINITLADLQERKFREQQEAKEEEDWQGKTKEEREIEKEDKGKEADEFLNEDKGKKEFNGLEVVGEEL